MNRNDSTHPRFSTFQAASQRVVLRTQLHSNSSARRSGSSTQRIRLHRDTPSQKDESRADKLHSISINIHQLQDSNDSVVLACLEQLKQMDGIFPLLSS